MAMIHTLASPESEAQLQEDINTVSQCLEDELSLQLNAKKCQYTVFTRSPKGPKELQLTVGGTQLKQVHTYRYLGVQMDERLSFTHQVFEATTKARRGIGAVSRSVRKWASKDVLTTSIRTLIMPALLYAVEVWYPPNSKDQLLVERVQKYAARLISNNFHHESTYDALLEETKWKPILRLVIEKQLVNMKKYTSGTRFIPAEVFQSSSECSERRSQRLRSSQSVQTIFSQGNSHEEKLAAAKTRLLWNALR
jgi:hypothetical protein